MLINSNDIGSRSLMVILTPRKVVFMLGDTETTVPDTMVPSQLTTFYVVAISLVYTDHFSAQSALILKSVSSGILLDMCTVVKNNNYLNNETTETYLTNFIFVDLFIANVEKNAQIPIQVDR